MGGKSMTGDTVHPYAADLFSIKSRISQADRHLPVFEHGNIYRCIIQLGIIDTRQGESI
jgi:hypothetical protein